MRPLHSLAQSESRLTLHFKTSLRIRNQTEHHAKMMQSTSQSAQAESALFDDDDDDDDDDSPATEAAKTSSQHAKSMAKTPLTVRRLPSLCHPLRCSRALAPLQFQEIERTGGHCIQTIRELQTTYVIITSDMSKSRTSPALSRVPRAATDAVRPTAPVLKVLACSPFVDDK